MGTEDEPHPYESLDHAFEGHKIPFENRELLRLAMSRLPITGYFSRAGYIKATRSDSRRAIAIHSGYTNGFLSEDEARAATGLVPYRSARGWGVTHPTNKIRDGGETHTVRREREAKMCPTCSMQLAVSGACSNCG